MVERLIYIYTNIAQKTPQHYTGLLNQKFWREKDCRLLLPKAVFVAFRLCLKPQTNNYQLLLPAPANARVKISKPNKQISKHTPHLHLDK